MSSEASPRSLGPTGWAWAMLLAVACGSTPPSETDTAQASTDTSTPTTESPDTRLDQCPEELDLFDLADPGGTLYTDGAPALMVHGPQGGWHVAVQARVGGATSVEATGEVVLSTSGVRLGGDDNTFTLTIFGWDTAECEGRLQGLIVYLDDTDVDQAAICDLVGEPVTLTATVDDPATGRRAEATVELILAPDPGDSCGI